MPRRPLQAALMGTACSCDAELEVAELDVQGAHHVKDIRSGVRKEDEDFQCDLGEDGVLGCSSLGTVVKTRCRNNNTVCAVKRISKRNIEGSEWKEEVMTIQKLDHPHVCKLHEALEDIMSVYLIMELCQGGDLMNISQNQRSFSEGTVAVLVRQMTSAVAHLHDHDIVHSDIRPENWLFESPVESETSVLDMTLKMIDFGLASKHGRGRLKPTVGKEGPTPLLQPVLPLPHASTSQVKCRRAADLRDFRRGVCCMAPEQLDGCADGKADVWALGVLSYFLLSGQTPFDVSEGVTTLENHLSFRNARFVFMPADIWRPVSTEAKNFVALCLSKDPEQRPSAQQMLSLPWMRLAKAVSEDDYALRSPGKGREDSRWPMFFDNILPTSQDILGNLSRLKRCQVLEKAAVIIVARSLHGDELVALRVQLEGMDAQREGTLQMTQILQALADSWSVKCEELIQMAEDGCVGKVNYAEFIADVGDFQNNMQDSAVSAVFRAFDSAGEQETSSGKESWRSLDCTLPECSSMRNDSKMKRKFAAAALRQSHHVKSIEDAFPRISMKMIQEDLQSSPNSTINYEELHGILRKSKVAR